MKNIQDGSVGSSNDEDEEFYKCEVCGKKSTTPGHLNSHRLIVHKLSPSGMQYHEYVNLWMTKFSRARATLLRKKVEETSNFPDHPSEGKRSSGIATREKKTKRRGKKQTEEHRGATRSDNESESEEDEHDTDEWSGIDDDE